MPSSGDFYNASPGGGDDGGNGTMPTSPAHAVDQSLRGASGPEILGVVWSLTFIAACFLAARLYVKKRHDKGFWWDDYLLVVSWLMLALFAAATTYCVNVGLGSHSTSSVVQHTALQLSILIATVFSVLGAAWSKTSFALTLLRITRHGNRLLYWGIWCVVLVMNVVLGFNAIVQFVWCVPVQAAWNANLEGQCWDRNVVVIYTQFAAYYSAAMDFLLAAIPVTVIAKLSIRVKEKLGVIFCMSLGTFAGATSIMRATTVPTLSGSDYTYQAGLLFIWTGAEIASTIVAASIPILRVLVRELRGSRYPEAAELNTIKSMGLRVNGGGIQVTKETIISRSASKVDRGRKLGLQGDEDGLLTPLTPSTPLPTYHSYVQA